MIIFIFILFNTLLFISINNLNILSLKYYLIIFGVLFLLEIISIVFLLLKKKVFKIIGFIFTILIILVNICGIYYLKVTNDFFDKSMLIMCVISC